jgi:hypothetical protein
VSIRLFFTSVLDGGEWSPSRLNRFISCKKGWFPLSRRLGGPHSLSGRFGDEKDFLSLPERRRKAGNIEGT